MLFSQSENSILGGLSFAFKPICKPFSNRNIIKMEAEIGQNDRTDNERGCTGK